MVAAPKLVTMARTRLVGPTVRVSDIDVDASGKPGLYALYGSRATWRELGLGAPPDSRPLYVGKAESTLASRDLQGHFGMRPRGAQSPTGSSTVRRSLAALLAPARGYRGMPRNPDKPGHFSSFGLSPDHDEDLSTWMKRRLRLAVWPYEDPGVLDGIETEVLNALLPPLNVDKVVTPWRAQDQVRSQGACAASACMGPARQVRPVTQLGVRVRGLWAPRRFRNQPIVRGCPVATFGHSPTSPFKVLTGRDLTEHFDRAGYAAMEVLEVELGG